MGSTSVPTLAVMRASPSSYRLLTNGSWACMPNVAHGCVPFGTAMGSNDSRANAAPPRMRAYCSYEVVVPSQPECGTIMLNESAPPAR